MAKQSAGQDESKGQKGAKYPYYSLQKSIEVAAAVRDCGGARDDVNKSVLAHRLATDGNSTKFASWTSSAKCFGLIQGWGSYSLTDTAKELFYPADENQKRRAMLRIIKSPPVFAHLIDRYDGTKLPDADLIANILHREHDVPRSWMPRVASLFISSVREAGIVDNSGFLRYASLMHSPSDRMPQKDEPPPSPPTEEDSQGERQREADSHKYDVNVNVWMFSGTVGGTLRVETPRELTRELWDKLSKYVRMLEPDSKEGNGS